MFEVSGSVVAILHVEVVGCHCVLSLHVVIVFE